MSDPESFATTLLVLVVDRYGTEATGWHPTTLALQIRDDFGVELSRLALDKLMAAIVIVTSDDFFKNLPKFNDLCNVLAGSPASPDVFDPADPWEMAWAITEALLLWPPDEDEPFCDDIRYYIGFSLNDNGFVRPPDVLRIALDGDASDRVRGNYPDGNDPLFSEIYKMQSDKVKEVETMVKGNLAALIGQLESLPLKVGSMKGLTGRLRQEMARGGSGKPDRDEQLASILR